MLIWNKSGERSLLFSFSAFASLGGKNGVVNDGKIDGAEGPFMKVSVVTPVYNGGEYLRPFLDSCINQNMDDIEFVLVDDGSTDGSREALAEYAGKDNRIHAIFCEHRGVGPTVKTGEDAATGDYLMFTDDDDIIMPKAIERLYEASEGIADVVKGTALIENDGKLHQSNAFKSTEPLDWQRMSYDMLLRHFLQPPEIWSYIFKRELVPLIKGGDYMFGDTDKVFKAKVLAKDFRYIVEPVYTWRIHESVSHSDKFPFDIVKVYDNLEKFLKERNVNIWPIFGTSKYLAYEWNLGRLAGENLRQFVEIMKRDFQGEVIDTRILSPEQKIKLELMLACKTLPLHSTRADLGKTVATHTRRAEADCANPVYAMESTRQVRSFTTRFI